MKNIILFLTCDHGAWANGFYGNKHIITPTLDKLANDGIVFENAFTPTPVCSPSRACLMTGKTPSQIGIHDWLEETYDDIANKEWLNGQKTLFDYIKTKGYYNALLGKWHLGRSHFKPSGVDYHFGIHHWQGNHNENYEYVLNGDLINLDGNKSEFVTDHAIKFLNNYLDKPKFLKIGYIATHSPYTQQSHDRKITKLYHNNDFKELPIYKAHPFVKNEGTPNHPTEEELRDRYIGYYSAVTEIDKNIQRIITHLDNINQLKDTLIIYTSDHGCAIGHHGFFGKGNSTRPLNMYETSLRIPLFFYGYGKNSQRVSNYVDHYDTFQTLLDLLDFKIDKNIFPGKSFLEILNGNQNISWDNTKYGEYGDLRMVRNKNHKLIIRYSNKNQNSFFDLNNDPEELYDTYEKTKDTDDFVNLHKKLKHFYKKYSSKEYSGLKVKTLPRHNYGHEAWRPYI